MVSYCPQPSTVWFRVRVSKPHCGCPYPLLTFRITQSNLYLLLSPFVGLVGKFNIKKKKTYFFLSCLDCKACRILVSWPDSQPMTPRVEARNLFFFKCEPLLKSLLSLLQHCSCFLCFVFFGWEACETLNPWPGLESVTSTVASPNHWTIREFPKLNISKLKFESSSPKLFFPSSCSFWITLHPPSPLGRNLTVILAVPSLPSGCWRSFSSSTASPLNHYLKSVTSGLKSQYHKLKLLTRALTWSDLWVPSASFYTVFPDFSRSSNHTGFALQ